LKMDPAKQAILKLQEDMYLDQAMARNGCVARLFNDGEDIEVFSRDGSVVYLGSMAQFKINMMDNIKKFGEPIIHQKVTWYKEECASERGRRMRHMQAAKFAYQQSLKALEESFAAASVEPAVEPEPQKEEAAATGWPEVSGESTWDDGVQEEEEEGVVTKGYEDGYVMIAKKGAEVAAPEEEVPPARPELPENRVGKLQEIYQAWGLRPEYKMMSRKESDGRLTFVCQVIVPATDAIAIAKNKKSAKQKCAGNMLLALRGEKPYQDDVLWGFGAPAKADTSASTGSIAQSEHIYEEVLPPTLAECQVPAEEDAEEELTCCLPGKKKLSRLLKNRGKAVDRKRTPNPGKDKKMARRARQAVKRHQRKVEYRALVDEVTKARMEQRLGEVNSTDINLDRTHISLIEAADANLAREGGKWNTIMKEHQATDDGHCDEMEAIAGPGASMVGQLGQDENKN